MKGSARSLPQVPLACFIVLPTSSAAPAQLKPDAVMDEVDNFQIGLASKFVALKFGRRQILRPVQRKIVNFMC